MFGENVRRKREEAGMSIPELAEKVNTTKQMISLIELDRKAPGLFLARDIAAALNCKIDDLFREAI